jgi:glycosyltransferase involved in cell wall biosynthesis
MNLVWTIIFIILLGLVAIGVERRYINVCRNSRPKEDKLRIAYIGSRGIPNSYASAEELIYHLGPYLVEHGHEVLVYCHGNLFKDHTPNYQGVQRIFIPTIIHKVLGQGIYAFLGGIDLAFREVDIIHVQALPPVPFMIFSWLLGQRIMANVDGQEWLSPKWGEMERRLFFGLAARLAVAMSRVFVTDAIGMHQIYKKRFGRESAVIEYGADVEESQRPEVLQKYGVEPGEYYIVASRIDPSNNHHLILDAFNQIDTHRTLAIAGGQSYGSRYWKELQSKAGSRVKFLGHVSNRLDMKELYCNSFAYLHGHSKGGVNSALLRPLGCGACAVAYDTPFNREVLQMNDGRWCGLIWKDVEQLTQILNRLESEPGLAGTVKVLGQKRILERFRWDQICGQYAELYCGIAGHHDPVSIYKAVAEVVQ